MRAKFINEIMNFKKNRDPKDVLGLNYGNKPKTKAWKILEFIRSKGKEGASLKEIQKFIYVDLHGHTEEEFYKKSDPTYGGISYGRATRGYWNTNLFGVGKEGLLPRFCTREVKPNGEIKWVLKRMPEPGENLFAE